MIKLLEIRDTLQRAVWDVDATALSGPRALLVRVLRLIHGVGRDLGEGQLTLRAMSLVYTTLLSLVPLLAFSFSGVVPTSVETLGRVSEFSPSYATFRSN